MLEVDRTVEVVDEPVVSREWSAASEFEGDSMVGDDGREFGDVGRV